MRNTSFILRPLAVAALLCTGATHAASPLLGNANNPGLVRNLTGTVNGVVNNTLTSLGELPIAATVDTSARPSRNLRSLDQTLADLRVSLNLNTEGRPSRGLGLEGVDSLLTPRANALALPGLEGAGSDRPLQRALEAAAERREDARNQRADLLQQLANESDEAREARENRIEELREARQDAIDEATDRLEDAENRRDSRLAALADLGDRRMARAEQAQADANARREARRERAGEQPDTGDRDRDNSDDNGFLGVGNSSTLGTDDGSDNDSGVLGAGDSSTLGTDNGRDSGDNGFLGAGNSSTLGTN